VKSPVLRLWAWPIVLGALTATGLTTALISDGWGDTWAWLALGVPIAVMARFSLWTQSATESETNSSDKPRP
jgi:hypothetical protein